MTPTVDTFAPLFIPNQYLEQDFFRTLEGCRVFSFTTLDTSGREVHADITLFCD